MRIGSKNLLDSVWSMNQPRSMNLKIRLIIAPAQFILSEINGAFSRVELQNELEVENFSASEYSGNIC